MYIRYYTEIYYYYIVNNDVDTGWTSNSINIVTSYKLYSKIVFLVKRNELIKKLIQLQVIVKVA